jgi:RNA polymerase sigma factor (sigma-70 family)
MPPARFERSWPGSSVSSDERFERVVREYGAALRRLASAWERDRTAQEDLLQEILVALWRALPRFRGEASERTFVFRVALNRAMTHRFRRAPPASPLDDAAHLADSRQSPEAEAAAAQQRERLVAALQSLSPSLREAVTLSLEGLSGGEIADVLGITENNAMVRLSRARRALWEAMNRP